MNAIGHVTGVFNKLCSYVNVSAKTSQINSFKLNAPIMWSQWTLCIEAFNVIKVSKDNNSFGNFWQKDK